MGEPITRTVADVVAQYRASLIDFNSHVQLNYDLDVGFLWDDYAQEHLRGQEVIYVGCKKTGDLWGVVVEYSKQFTPTAFRTFRVWVGLFTRQEGAEAYRNYVAMVYSAPVLDV